MRYFMYDSLYYSFLTCYIYHGACFWFFFRDMQAVKSPIFVMCDSKITRAHSVDFLKIAAEGFDPPFPGL